LRYREKNKIDINANTGTKIGLRGNVIREVSNLLPEEIDLLVYA